MRAPALAFAAVLALGGAALAAGADTTSSLFLGFQTKSADPINVTADSLEVFDQGTERISLFKGAVKVTRGPTTMTADSMKLYSSNASSATNGFTRIEADGQVHVTSADQTVTGDHGVVDNLANTITLSGNVVLSQGGSVITGNRLVIDMTSGRMKVEQERGQQIRGVFAPGSVDMAAPGGG